MCSVHLLPGFGLTEGSQGNELFSRKMAPRKRKVSESVNCKGDSLKAERNDTNPQPYIPPLPKPILILTRGLQFWSNIKKGINQQSSSNSNYLLLETACLSMEKQKYPRNILIMNMQISRLAGAVFSPLRSVPPCLHCPLAKCWTDGHRFWVSTLPMGTGNCTSLWDSVAHSHVWHGGGGCCTTLPGILSFLDWRSTAEGSDMPCVKASVRGAGR